MPSSGAQVLLGLVLGVALGLLARSLGGTAEDPDALTTTLTTIGSTFVQLLFTLVPPLVLLAIVASVADLAAVTNAARLAGQTLLWSAITALVSVGIGLGLGLTVSSGDAGPRLSFSVLQTIVLAIAVGIGTVGLLGRAVATYGWDGLALLGVFVVDVDDAIVLFVVHPVLLRVHGLSVRRFFTGAWPAIQPGFVSRSSVGTMPMTERVTERLGVSRSCTSFAVPGVGLLLAIDPILDMGRTAVNVAGQALVPVIVAAREGILDRTRYDTARGADVVADAVEAPDAAATAEPVAA